VYLGTTAHALCPSAQDIALAWQICTQKTAPFKFQLTVSRKPLVVVG